MRCERRLGIALVDVAPEALDERWRRFTAAHTFSELRECRRNMKASVIPRERRGGVAGEQLGLLPSAAAKQLLRDFLPDERQVRQKEMRLA